MRASTLLMLATFVSFAFAACAPLKNQTHYQRWDAYTAAQPEEEPEGPEAGPKDMKTTAKPKVDAKRPAPPPAPADYSSLGGDSTPAIGTRTATATRVVQPEKEPEDEPIY